jgi:3-phenylpropionate/trans-cinnamate dioxygenase ferredoxin subunit
MEQAWHRFCALGDLGPGKMSTRILAGREVLVCRLDEGVFAVQDRCSHAEARMSEGRLRGCRLTCPLHGAAFDLRDGRVLGRPATLPLQTFPVRIEEGFVEVLLPDPEPEVPARNP